MSADFKRQAYSIRMRVDLLDRLKALAKTHDRSVNYLLEQCAEAYLPILEREPPPRAPQFPPERPKPRRK